MNRLFFVMPLLFAPALVFGQGRGLDPADTELSARIASYELAFRMQAEAPEAVDLSRETEETKRLYGLDEPNELLL